MSSPRHSIRWVLALGALVGSAHVAAAPTSGSARLLVLLRDPSALAIVDPVAGTILGRVPTVSSPHEVTASADGKLACVASPIGGISAIDLDTLAVTGQMPTGPESGPGCMFWLQR